MAKNIEAYLLGYAGHAYVVAEAALLAGINIAGYVDKLPVNSNPFNLEYIGDERSVDFMGWTLGIKFIPGIGENKTRVKVARFVRSKGFEVLSVFHPDSFVSSYTKIESGVFIARNAAVNPLCKIGANVIINTSASIDHECTIGDGTHIAPGAVLAGNVNIGKLSFIGANAVIKHGVTIGDHVVVGAGAVVLDNIRSGEKVVGNPSRAIND